jgi:DNA replicative helicase MCM subunit Mcm2 (Cdc46/Mcm family)
MQITEEGSSKGVDRMKEDQNRQKEIPSSEKKIQRELFREEEAEEGEGEKEIKEIRREREVVKYINRERKKKEPVSEEITMQEWEDYFTKLMDGR